MGGDFRSAVDRAYDATLVQAPVFALSSAEANQLPRTVWPRAAGGVMYRYEGVAEGALELAGGMAGVRERLRQRAREQASIEAAFGDEWRALQWGPRAWVVAV